MKLPYPVAAATRPSLYGSAANEDTLAQAASSIAKMNRMPRWFIVFSPCLVTVIVWTFRAITLDISSAGTERLSGWLARNLDAVGITFRRMSVGRDADHVALRVEEKAPDLERGLSRPGAERGRHLLRELARAYIHLHRLDHTPVAPLDVCKHGDRCGRDVVLDLPVIRV